MFNATGRCCDRNFRFVLICHWTTIYLVWPKGRRWRRFSWPHFKVSTEVNVMIDKWTNVFICLFAYLDIQTFWRYFLCDVSERIVNKQITNSFGYRYPDNSRFRSNIIKAILRRLTIEFGFMIKPVAYQTFNIECCNKGDWRDKEKFSFFKEHNRWRSQLFVRFDLWREKRALSPSQI